MTETIAKDLVNIVVLCHQYHPSSKQTKTNKQTNKQTKQIDWRLKRNEFYNLVSDHGQFICTYHQKFNVESLSRLGQQIQIHRDDFPQNSGICSEFRQNLLPLGIAREG